MAILVLDTKLHVGSIWIGTWAQKYERLSYGKCVLHPSQASGLASGFYTPLTSLGSSHEQRH